MNYYNEFDPKAAHWLRSLIAAGLIPQGFVDERSIREVQPEDLEGYRQCHFFAGIGGWSRAFELAGLGAAENVWTGSCPCQSYSNAGKRTGNDDERNLWPEFFRLIRQCKPASVWGEQVAAAIRFGWLDGICRDLEGEGYSCGHAVLGAHSVGAPHIRQRLFWVADRQCWTTERWGYDVGAKAEGIAEETREQRVWDDAGAGKSVGGISYSNADRCDQGRSGIAKAGHDGVKRNGSNGKSSLEVSGEASIQHQSSRMGFAKRAKPAVSERCGAMSHEAEGTRASGQPQGSGIACTVGVAHGARLGEHSGSEPVQQEQPSVECAGGSGGLGNSHVGENISTKPGQQMSGKGCDSADWNKRAMQGTGEVCASGLSGFWSDFEFIPCRDGKARRVGTGIRCLAHGVSGRVAQLRGLGNAIVPQVAAEFIKAFRR